MQPQVCEQFDKPMECSDMVVREMINAANSWWERLDRKPGTWEAFEKTLRMEFVRPKIASQVIQDMC